MFSQAEENSRAAATEGLVTELGRVLGGAITPVQRDRLRDFSSRYAVSTQSATQSGGSSVFRTTLTLSPTFSNRSVLSSVSASGGSLRDVRLEQIGALRKRALAKPKSDTGFIEGTAVLPLNGGTVAVRAPDASRGSFVFTFSTSQAGNDTIRVAPTAIDVRQDGSAGATRWSFDVLVDGNLVIRIPSQRWDDQGRPTRCSLDPIAGFEATVPAKGTTVAVTVVGVKPDAMANPAPAGQKGT